MNVLLGISPRALSVCFTREIGNVIPTFSVLSSRVVRLILASFLLSTAKDYEEGKVRNKLRDPDLEKVV